jgi:hypothetical protein
MSNGYVVGASTKAELTGVGLNVLAGPGRGSMWRNDSADLACLRIARPTIWKT